MKSVENNPSSVRPLGPRKGAPGRPLSPSRTRVLDLVSGQPEPVTLAAVVRATQLHENTVRGHLDALVRRGLVRRHRAEPDGRGRPAWLYEATHVEPRTSEYAGLASALAGALASGPTPVPKAERAGADWGRELVRGRGGEAADPRAAVLELLDDLGFAPRPAEEDGLAEAGQEIALTHCPLLEAARRHTDVGCAVHLGIVRGALAELGADPGNTDLVPFDRPGSCTLRLGPGRPDSP